MKPNMEYEWTRGGKCSECKQEFVGMHLKSKTTCSSKCRKARERRQKQALSAHVVIMLELSRVRDSLKRREDMTLLRSQLERIKAEVNDLLWLSGDPDILALHEMREDRARKVG